jgi:hypothetical protein
VRADADAVRAEARRLGADAVGIASAAVLNAYPPDPAVPQVPARIWPEARSAIAFTKRIRQARIQNRRSLSRNLDGCLDGESSARRSAGPCSAGIDRDGRPIGGGDPGDEGGAVGLAGGVTSGP